MFIFFLSISALTATTAPKAQTQPAIVRMKTAGQACEWLKGTADDNGAAMFKVQAPCASLLLSTHPNGRHVLMAQWGSTHVWSGDLEKHRLDLLPELPHGRAVWTSYDGETTHIMSATDVTSGNANALGVDITERSVKAGFPDAPVEPGIVVYNDLALKDGKWQFQQSVSAETEQCDQDDYTSFKSFDSMLAIEQQQACPTTKAMHLSRPLRGKINRACDDGPWDYRWMQETAHCKRPADARLMRGPAGWVLAACSCYYEGADEEVRRDVGNIMAMRDDNQGEPVSLLDNATFDPFDRTVSLSCRGSDVLVARQHAQGQLQSPREIWTAIWRLQGIEKPSLRQVYHGRAIFLPQPAPGSTPANR